MIIVVASYYYTRDFDILTKNRVYLLQHLYLSLYKFSLILPFDFF